MPNLQIFASEQNGQKKHIQKELLATKCSRYQKRGLKDLFFDIWEQIDTTRTDINEKFFEF